MTSKTMTRHDFLRLTITVVGGATILGTFGCPGDDGGGEEGGNASSGSDGSGGGTTGGTTMSPGDTGGTTTTPDPDSGSTAAAGGCETDPSVNIQNNHGHELVVPFADLEAGVEVVYDIQGTSDHPHTVTLGADHFADLLARTAVIVDSSTEGHSHVVTIFCS
ncbi:MAG: hypothetical protein KC501_11430 [Myxococcales bacterium]|nr:hypothetical protein [Myxococcales bacterium]